MLFYILDKIIIKITRWDTSHSDSSTVASEKWSHFARTRSTGVHSPAPNRRASDWQNSDACLRSAYCRRRQRPVSAFYFYSTELAPRVVLAPEFGASALDSACATIRPRCGACVGYCNWITTLDCHVTLCCCWRRTTKHLNARAKVYDFLALVSRMALEFSVKNVFKMFWSSFLHDWNIKIKESTLKVHTCSRNQQKKIIMHFLHKNQYFIMKFEQFSNC